jgi:formate dehydrogenase iron-sulfur subunit
MAWADETMLGGLNSFYLIVDEPEVYGLPRDPKLPSRNLVRSSLLSTAGAVALAVLGLIGFRHRRMEERAASEEGRSDA